jgi:hypothetical protein
LVSRFTRRTRTTEGFLAGRSGPLGGHSKLECEMAQPTPASSSFALIVSLLGAAVVAIVSTLDYRKKSRWFAERHAELDRLESELEKIPPVPGSQRFRADPALQTEFKARMSDLIQKAPKDRAARLALEQLVMDELVVLAQREELLTELAEPSGADRDELAAIPAQRKGLNDLLRYCREGGGDPRDRAT